MCRLRNVLLFSMVLQISYELDCPGQHYDALYKAIKDISGIWCHPMTSHWLVETSLSPEQVYKRLTPHIDKNDFILVMRVTNSPAYYGYLSETSWAWLGNRTF